MINSFDMLSRYYPIISNFHAFVKTSLLFLYGVVDTESHGVVE